MKRQLTRLLTALLAVILLLPVTAQAAPAWDGWTAELEAAYQTVSGLVADSVSESRDYSAMWDPQLLEVLRSLSPSSRSIFVVESLKSATRNFEKLLDILEFLLTHDLKFASTNFYIENGHVERRIKPLRAGHTSKEIQKNLSQTAGLGYRHAAALNQL